MQRRTQRHGGHEKDADDAASVRAASALLAQLEGNWISNAPRKLAPKMSNSRSRNTLKMGSVGHINTSTPKKAVKANPRAVYEDDEESVDEGVANASARVLDCS